MYRTESTIEPNRHEDLSKDSAKLIEMLDGKWPNKNTAILINHGIGNQKPIETLDTFSRGILKALKIYNKEANRNFTVEHRLVPKKMGDEAYYWFDNFIRIRKNGQKKHIDLYEYYWAANTEDKTSISKIRDWLRDVTKGAKKHYASNKNLIEHYEDDSIFSNSDGSFNSGRYFFVLRLLGGVFLILSSLFNGLLWCIKNFIPFFGRSIAELLENWKQNSALDLTNILGDITVYNDPNPRSCNQAIRKEILKGCVKALTSLIVENETGEFSYDKIVIAGHSLGSQISFDAINRLTHQINLGELPGYNKRGFRLKDTSKNITDVLDTYITFGSPLDKIAFFLREHNEKEEYIRAQILENFHCFKQNAWLTLEQDQERIETPIERIFDNIKWKNYYDDRDYVSGALDFYKNLTNVNCKFPSSTLSFTHSNYWQCSEFFGDVLITLL